jgi:DNA-binding response OmpR family regulator
MSPFYTMMPRRVVVADDDPKIRRFVASVLAEYPGLLVEYHESAPSALSSLRSGDLSLFVAAVRLGELEGLELCKAVRSDFPHARTVLLASRTGRSPRLDGAVDAFIAPPYSARKFSRIVDQIL